MEVYSPAVSSAAAEYLATITLQDDRRRRPAYGRGSRQRLMNLDVPERAIAAIEKSRSVPTSIEWTSPRDGIVLERRRDRGHARAARRRAVPDRRSFRGLGADRRRRTRSRHDRHRPVGHRAGAELSRARVLGEGRGRSIPRSTRRRGPRVSASNCRIPTSLLLHDMYVDAEIDTGSGEPVAVRARERGDGHRQPAGRLRRQGAGPLRTTRGQARPSRRRLRRGPARASPTASRWSSRRTS